MNEKTSNARKPHTASRVTVLGHEMLNRYRAAVPYTPKPGIMVTKNGYPLRRPYYSTGNMQKRAWRGRKISRNEFMIEVDTSIAPYVCYTNEPWISPYWFRRGTMLKNPNLHWFNNVAESMAQDIAAKLHGRIVRG